MILGRTWAKYIFFDEDAACILDTNDSEVATQH